MTQAANHYRLPPLLLVAIRQQEAGQVGMKNANTNGTYDYGVMQINSIWLPKLATFGYTEQTLQFSACANVYAGAWILAQELQEAGVWLVPDPSPTIYWQAVGAYHSETPGLNGPYALAVHRRYLALTQAPGGFTPPGAAAGAGARERPGASALSRAGGTTGAAGSGAGAGEAAPATGLMVFGADSGSGIFAFP